MNNIEIIKPTIENQKEINELAKQVHKMHVNWNPDLFLDVEDVISVERLERLLENDSIFVAKSGTNIVGYIILEITIIFAHSIAPVFICKFLISNKIKVKRLVFVCGFNNYLGINEEYDNVNGSMYLDHLQDIKKYCDDIICYYSKNDPYVKYEFEKEFADTIATEQIIIENGGHLNSESGYTEFVELLKWI